MPLFFFLSSKLFLLFILEALVLLDLLIRDLDADAHWSFCVVSNEELPIVLF